MSVVLVKNGAKQSTLSVTARAAAVAELRSAATTAAVSLYSMGDGDDARTTVLACNEFVATVMQAMEFLGRRDEVDYRVMAGAMSAMVQISEINFRWSTKHAVAVDQGLKRAQDVFDSLRPHSVRRAWYYLRTGLDLGSST